MRIEIEVLDGPEQGKKISLRQGLVLGSKGADFLIQDPQVADQHAVITFDQKNTWNIECLGALSLRLGTVEKSRASLMPGLIFHLGQTGFKVVPKKQSQDLPWKESLKQWLSQQQVSKVKTDIFFYLHPVRLNFVQGPQFGEFYTLSYGPREIGYNSLDIDLKDPNSPTLAVKFLQEGDKVVVENFSTNQSLINDNYFDKHFVNNGDRLTVGSSVIELSILK